MRSRTVEIESESGLVYLVGGLPGDWENVCCCKRWSGENAELKLGYTGAFGWKTV